MAASSKKTKKGKRRAPKPPTYKRRGPDVALGREHFRLVLRRGRRKLPAVSLDELVEHVDWTRDGSFRTGELNFRRPLGVRGVELVQQADSIDLYVAPIGSSRWRLVWRMQVDMPNHQIKEGIISVALKSALKPAQEQRRGWKQRAGRRAHQIARYAAQRFHVRVGRLAVGHARLPKLLKKKASVVDVVTWAYKHERERTGRRFDVDLSRGVLDVVELKDSRYMLELGPAIIDATISHDLKGLATALVVTSTRKVKGSNKRTKLRVKVVDRARQRRYGYIVRHVSHAGLDSRAEARRWAKRRLARMQRPKRAVTFTHPGIPWLDRGQACTLYLPDEGLHRVCWVKAVRHTLAAGSYEMELEVGFGDPYRDARRERVKKRREAAARRRKRRARGDTHTTPRTKKAARRAAA